MKKRTSFPDSLGKIQINCYVHQWNSAMLFRLPGDPAFSSRSPCAVNITEDGAYRWRLGLVSVNREWKLSLKGEDWWQSAEDGGCRWKLGLVSVNRGWKLPLEARTGVSQQRVEVIARG